MTVSLKDFEMLTKAGLGTAAAKLPRKASQLICRATKSFQEGDQFWCILAGEYE